MISANTQRRLIRLARKGIVNKTMGEAKGVSCRWVKIAESWGVKFTPKPFEYLRSVFVNQRRGWRLGLGPYCFGLLKITIDDVTYHGYITQIAQIAWQYCVDRGISWAQSREVFKATIRHISRIVKKELGVTAYDLHTENLGFINNRLVITDWGFD